MKERIEWRLIQVRSRYMCKIFTTGEVSLGPTFIVAMFKALHLRNLTCKIKISNLLIPAPLCTGRAARVDLQVLMSRDSKTPQSNGCSKRTRVSKIGMNAGPEMQTRKTRATWRGSIIFRFTLCSFQEKMAIAPLRICIQVDVMIQQRSGIMAAVDHEEKGYQNAPISQSRTRM